MGRNIDVIREQFKPYIDILFNNGMSQFLDSEISLEELNNNLACNGYDIRLHSDNGATRLVFDFYKCNVFGNDIEKDIEQYVFKYQFLDCNINYNENERLAYKYAESKNSEQFFAWCDFFMTYDGNDKEYPIYIMEYCHSVEDEFEEIAKESLDNMIRDEFEEECYYRELDEEEDAEEIEELRTSINEKYSGIYSGDSGDVYDYVLPEIFSPDEIYKLNNIVDKLNINDLHSGNFGLTADDRFVIIDYAGFEVELNVA